MLINYRSVPFCLSIFQFFSLLHIQYWLCFFIWDTSLQGSHCWRRQNLPGIYCLLFLHFRTVLWCSTCLPIWYRWIKVAKIKVWNIFSVICAVTSDCSTVTGFTSCKELTIGGPLTCQATSSCLATAACSSGEYCTFGNICSTRGVQEIWVLKEWVYNFSCLPITCWLWVSHWNNRM